MRDNCLNSSSIQTYTGRLFYPLNPVIEDIVIEDIAHSLALQCRFAGHTSEFYSVAQHSVFVSEACPTEAALWGLLHDASEAYLIDVPRPLKHSKEFKIYRKYEKIVQDAICQRFNLSLIQPRVVKEKDDLLLCTEARDFMGYPEWIRNRPILETPLSAWSPQKAEKLFLKVFANLANNSL